MSESQMGSTVKATPEQYVLGESLPDDRLANLPAGSNLLVAGPSMIGKDRIAMQIVARGQQQGEPALLVSTDSAADQLLSAYERAGGTRDEAVYVVDCSGTSGKGSFEETARMKYVSSPGDLTGIGIGVAKCMQAIGDGATNGLRSSMISLSTLLEYASEQRVFDFTHVVGGRISAADYLGVWTLDTTSHDQQTVSTLRGQFDYVAELRETDRGEREMRVLGGDAAWRTWQPITDDSTD